MEKTFLSLKLYQKQAAGQIWHTGCILPIFGKTLWSM